MYDKLCGIPFFEEIRNVVEGGKFEAYFVGGCVRDIILDRRVHDVDMVCFSHDYKDFASAVKKALPSVWVDFKDNIRLVRGRFEIDISKPRGAKLADDLAKRDFTINNLAMDTMGNIFGCRADIDKRIIRHTGADAFRDDPLRLLRAYRFQAQLGFQIAPETADKIRAEKGMISASASERIYAEMDKLLDGQHSAGALADMDETGLFDAITGLRIKDENLSAAGAGRGLVFFCASVFYGLDAEVINSLTVRLNLPNTVKKRALRTADFARSLPDALENGVISVRKLIYRYQDEHLDGACLYRIHHNNSESEEAVLEQSHHVDFALAEKLNGQLLREIGVADGPVMGDILKTVRPMLASGELADVNEAVRFIKDKYL
jgi:tRNA nucleotidyltransferase/poly(A) polymerase